MPGYWEIGIMEYWEKPKKTKSFLNPVFQYSNIPLFRCLQLGLSLFLRQTNDFHDFTRLAGLNHAEMSWKAKKL